MLPHPPPTPFSVAHLSNVGLPRRSETSYDVTDSSFPDCSVNRPSGGSAGGRMYLVNHFLDVDIFGIDIPDETAASTTNGEDSIMAEVNECNALYDRYPNFILVRNPLSSTADGVHAC